MIPIRLIVLCLLVAGFRPPSLLIAAEPIELVRSVIRRQMEAFNENDFPTAYTFASQSIRQRFSRERFERMVKSGYLQIAKSHLASFGEIVLSGISKRRRRRSM